MKSYEEMAESIFARRDKYIKKKRKLKRTLFGATTTLMCCSIAVAAVFGIRQQANTPKLPITATKDTTALTEPSKYTNITETSGLPNEDEVAPTVIIWGEDGLRSEFSVDTKDLLSSSLLKTINNADRETYIGVFVKCFNTCGLVPEITLKPSDLPENVDKDGALTALISKAALSYEEYEKYLNDFLKEGYPVYRAAENKEFVSLRNKALNDYNSYHNYVDSEVNRLYYEKLKEMNERLLTVDIDTDATKLEWHKALRSEIEQYEAAIKLIQKNHFLETTKTRNRYFSSFGFTPCYSLTYLEENFDKYYGEGYEVNPGYFYIAQTKSIVRLNKYFDGKTNAFAIFHAYNITEVYSK